MKIVLMNASLFSLHPLASTLPWIRGMCRSVGPIPARHIYSYLMCIIYLFSVYACPSRCRLCRVWRSRCVCPSHAYPIAPYSISPDPWYRHYSTVDIRHMLCSFYSLSPHLHRGTLDPLLRKTSCITCNVKIKPTARLVGEESRVEKTRKQRKTFSICAGLFQ